MSHISATEYHVYYSARTQLHNTLSDSTCRITTSSSLLLRLLRRFTMPLYLPNQALNTVAADIPAGRLTPNELRTSDSRMPDTW